MDYKKLFFILALGFLIPSLLIPWSSIDFIGESTEYTPLKITKDLVIKDNSNNAFNLIKMIKPYKASYLSMILSMILYFSSFYFLYQSYNIKSSKLLLISAVLIFASIGLYSFSIENYKTGFSFIANETGGIVGEEFKGDEREIINNILKKDQGYYLTIIAGIFSMLSYIWKKEN